MTRRDRVLSFMAGLALPLTVGLLWAVCLAGLILYANPRVDYTAENMHWQIREGLTDGCVQSPLPGCVPSPYPGATKGSK